MTPEFSLRENSDVVPSAEQSQSFTLWVSQELTPEFFGGLYRRQIPACPVSSALLRPLDLLISL